MGENEQKRVETIAEQLEQYLAQSRTEHEYTTEGSIEEQLAQYACN